MPNRHGDDADGYRYGFNGMESDDEVRGTKGASYDFGARMLDVRIGRWLSVDAFEGKYPAHSPYNFVKNMPVIAVDPDGNWVDITTNKYYKGKDGKPVLKTTFWHKFKKTTKIEKTVNVHGAKVYYDPLTLSLTDGLTAEQKQKEADDYISRVKNTWDGTYKKGDKEIIIEVNFVDGVKVIDDLSEAKSDGKKSDELYIVSSGGVVKEMGEHGNTEAIQIGQVTVLGTSAYYASSEYTKKTAGHEFGHRANLPDPAKDEYGNTNVKHRDKLSIMNYNPLSRKPNYYEANKFFGRNGKKAKNRSIKRSIRKYKKSYKKYMKN